MPDSMGVDSRPEETCELDSSAIINSDSLTPWQFETFSLTPKTRIRHHHHHENFRNASTMNVTSSSPKLQAGVQRMLPHSRDQRDDISSFPSLISVPEIGMWRQHQELDLTLELLRRARNHNRSWTSRSQKETHRFWVWHGGSGGVEGVAGNPLSSSSSCHSPSSSSIYCFLCVLWRYGWCQAWVPVNEGERWWMRLGNELGKEL